MVDCIDNPTHPSNLKLRDMVTSRLWKDRRVMDAGCLKTGQLVLFWPKNQLQSQTSMFRALVIGKPLPRSSDISVSDYRGNVPAKFFMPSNCFAPCLSEHCVLQLYQIGRARLLSRRHL